MILGCGRSQGAPRYNPQAAARDALATFDTNGNGTLESTEAAASPALNAAFPRIDSDQNAALSAAEIAARIQTYRAAKIGLMPFQCTVSFNGQPLENATVVLEPERFMAKALKPARGTTSSGGIAAPVVEGEQFPAVACGLYRVVVSRPDSGQETIPARYNSETTLGLEIAPDVPNLERGIYLELQSD